MNCDERVNGMSVLIRKFILDNDGLIKSDSDDKMIQVLGEILSHTEADNLTDTELISLAGITVSFNHGCENMTDSGLTGELADESNRQRALDLKNNLISIFGDWLAENQGKPSIFFWRRLPGTHTGSSAMEFLDVFLGKYASIAHEGIEIEVTLSA